MLWWNKENLMKHVWLILHSQCKIVWWVKYIYIFFFWIIQWYDNQNACFSLPTFLLYKYKDLVLLTNRFCYTCFKSAVITKAHYNSIAVVFIYEYYQNYTTVHYGSQFWFAESHEIFQQYHHGFWFIYKLATELLYILYENPSHIVMW